MPKALETAVIPGAAHDFYKATVLREIAAVRAKAGDVRGAALTIRRALDTAATIEAGFYKAEALREISKAQAETGDLRGALETAAAIPDASQKASALREIAEVQAKAGDVRGALETAAAIEDAFYIYKAKALREIAAARAEAGDVRGALETAAAIPDASQKASALREIAATQAMAGNSKEAARTFDQALEAARTITGIFFVTVPLFRDLERAIAVVSIAADRVEAGDVQGALAWAATLSGDPVAKVSVLVGVAAGVLQPTGRLGGRSMSPEKRLLPRWSNF